MALPNLIALLALSPVIIKESKQYFKKIMTTRQTGGLYQGYKPR